MNLLNQVLHNRVLIIAGAAWFTAGILKVIVELVINKEIHPSRVMGSGGMPSSHTSTVIALAIATAYDRGLSSTMFAITVILAIIVIHDAVGVRLETGKQAKVLNSMISNTDVFKDLDFENKLKEYVGHTPLQALVGAIVGIIVALTLIKILY